MNRIEIKKDNVSINRIEERCINCGMCKKTCENINNIGNDCVNCGQCIMTCPTGALTPKYNYKEVLNYIKDTNKTVVVFVAPAVRVAIGDSFGYKPGEFLEGKLVSALKEIGFNYVFDTTFGADLTIMEEAQELLERIKNKNTPMFTSCCPSWVLYMYKYHLNDISKLSTCKSPIAMQAAMIKTYFAQNYDIDSENIISVSLTPCVSKKSERELYPDTDIVITSSELILMIKELGIDFNALEDKEFDKLLGKGSGGGLIFGASGGVMESVLRTAYYMLNKIKAPQEFYQLESIRGDNEFKETIVDMKQFKLKIASLSKIKTVIENYDKLKDYDFIEIMSCPGGCIGGGGQPLVAIKDLENIRKERIKSLYIGDKQQKIKESYLNPEIIDAYNFCINKGKVNLHTNHNILAKNFTNNDKKSIMNEGGKK